jgi:hypothetical protein
VFSKTSLQRQYIDAANPRALYFNDTVAVAFIPGAPLLEVAALDPEQGVIFYTFEQRMAAESGAARQESCLSCHLSRNSMDVPGLLVRSLPAAANGRLFPQLGNNVTDHRSPLAERSMAPRQGPLLGWPGRWHPSTNHPRQVPWNGKSAPGRARCESESLQEAAPAMDFAPYLQRIRGVRKSCGGRQRWLIRDPVSI